MAITFFPGSREPRTRSSGSRVNALVLGYDGYDVSLFEAQLRQRYRTIFTPQAVIMAFLEVEKQKRFREVRLRRSGLRMILHRISSGEEVTEPPDRPRDVDDNIGLYLHVSDLLVDGLEPWMQRILSLKAQASDHDPQLSLDLHQLALQYEHRISRCDKILQGASLAYQMVSRLDPEHI